MENPNSLGVLPCQPGKPRCVGEGGRGQVKSEGVTQTGEKGQTRR